MVYSAASANACNFSLPIPHSAKPLLQRLAVSSAICSTLLPSRRAASGSIQGWKSAGCWLGKCSTRLVRSPFGSMIIAGVFFKAASSSKSMHKPVFPEPVIPVTTQWVVRFAESSSTSSCVGPLVFGSYTLPMK